MKEGKRRIIYIIIEESVSPNISLTPIDNQFEKEKKVTQIKILFFLK